MSYGNFVGPVFARQQIFLSLSECPLFGEIWKIVDDYAQYQRSDNAARCDQASAPTALLSFFVCFDFGNIVAVGENVFGILARILP